jgi:proteasome activator subunit 4
VKYLYLYILPSVIKVGIFLYHCRERYKKPSWETSIPAKFQLSEDRILKFVECLKPVVLLSMFNKMGSFEAATCLQQLAQLKPAVVLPTLLDRWVLL